MTSNEECDYSCSCFCLRIYLNKINLWKLKDYSHRFLNDLFVYFCLIHISFMKICCIFEFMNCFEISFYAFTSIFSHWYEWDRCWTTKTLFWTSSYSIWLFQLDHAWRKHNMSCWVIVCLSRIFSWVKILIMSLHLLYIWALNRTDGSQHTSTSKNIR